MIIEKVCIRFIHIESLNISYFQLKKSNIINKDDIVISPVYQIIHFIWTYIELIYDTENNMKNNIEYTIGRGKIGTWKGIGVNGWVYDISIQNKVSLPYICQPNKAHIKPIDNMNNKEIVIQSIKLTSLSFLILIVIYKTRKNHVIAQASEKL